MINKYIDINGSVYTIEQSSAIIEAPSSNGGKKYWQGHVLSRHMLKMSEPSGTAYFTASSAWRSTQDGLSKVVWSEPYYAESTNVGRVNERSNKEQAYFEFDSMVQKQKDKRNAEKPLPMLAHPFNKREKDIKYPCAVQPKFDGMRVLYDGQEAWSRGNKPIIPEVFAHLHFNTKGYIVDGELILPENVKVNKTMEAAKKFRKGLSDTLLYRVYDIVEPDMKFDDRFKLLKDIVENANANGLTNVILAETRVCRDKEEVLKWHEHFTTRGYEGTIIRNLNGLYAVNKRSADLQKHKDFVDAEFLIVDVVPAGGGSSAEVGKFVCVTENGDEFESTATGDENTRREYLTNKQKYIGKYAVVKFREYSGANNVPFHSNVLEIRETKEGGF